MSGGETPIETGTADDKHGARSYYFMGKDNITFHSQIWPAELLAYNGEGAKGGEPGALGELALPTEVVSSEFLTMEGRKFSSSRSVVIYVRDFLARYDADALRYFIAVAGPETTDTDFTWAEFLRRNNDELVAGWGNLVNRTISIAAKNFGAVPPAGPLTAEDDSAARLRTRRVRPTVGGLIARHRQKAAINEAMRIVGEANKYLSDQAPWKLKDDPERMGTILHVALQAIKRLQHAADAVPAALRAADPRAARRRPAYTRRCRIHRGRRRPRRRAGVPDPHRRLHAAARAGSRSRSWPGTPLSAPKPVFRKLDPSIVDEELARLAGAPQ